LLSFGTDELRTEICPGLAFSLHPFDATFNQHSPLGAARINPESEALAHDRLALPLAPFEKLYFSEYIMCLLLFNFHLA
jgi:hypothetical protein